MICIFGGPISCGYPMALGVNNGIRKDRSFYSRSGPSSSALCSLLRAALFYRGPPRVPERAYYSIIVCTMSECAGAPAGLPLGRLVGAGRSVKNNATTSSSTHTTVASATVIVMGRWSNLAIIAFSPLSLFGESGEHYSASSVAFFCVWLRSGAVPYSFLPPQLKWVSSLT
jgi:hypothetical protein